MPTTTVVLAAEPAAAFAALTDVAALPTWDPRVLVVHAHDDVLAPGDEWLAEPVVPGGAWRSRVLRVDPVEKVLVHLLGTDDPGDPFAVWTRRVEPHPAGSRVTVRWTWVTAGFGRRTARVLLRAATLRRAVRASLHALGDQLLSGDTASRR